MGNLKIILAVIFITISCFSCDLLKKDVKPSDDTTNGSTSNSNNSTSTLGMYTFYIKTDLGLGNINIYIDNVLKGSISHFHANGVTCGKGDVNVTASAGKHTFSAISDGGSTWNQELTFLNNSCNTLELVKSNSSSGSGSNGGTTNPTSNTGTRSFFIKTDLGRGFIRVTVDGIFRGTITHIHSNYICGQTDVNVMLTEGSHTYEAEAQDGWEWKGSFSVTRGQCAGSQFI